MSTYQNSSEKESLNRPWIKEQCEMNSSEVRGRHRDLLHQVVAKDEDLSHPTLACVLSLSLSEGSTSLKSYQLGTTTKLSAHVEGLRACLPWWERRVQGPRCPPRGSSLQQVRAGTHWYRETLGGT